MMWTKRLLVSMGLCLFGCSDGGDADGGSLTVLLEAEDTIVEGLDAGATGESIQDGWEIRFDRYIIVIGDIDLRSATDLRVTARAPELHAVDLSKIDAAGLPLWELSGLDAGEWELHYSVGSAGAAAAHTSVAAADFDTMAASNASYLVSGTLSRADGQSCPPEALATPGVATSNGTNSGGDPCFSRTTIAFELAVPAPTTFGPCEIDGVPGFSIAADASTSVAATIHGDHLFFNGFPEGDEGGIMRLAQWLADCDLDLDGEVTQAELERISPTDLPEIDGRFQLGGSPITPLTNMWDYVTAQLQTQGHFQGEGECPINGAP